MTSSLCGGDLLSLAPCACREMGCTIDRARADAADRAASPVSPQKQFRVRLLPEGLPGMPAKTLADAIPTLRIPRQPKKR